MMPQRGSCDTPSPAGADQDCAGDTHGDLGQLGTSESPQPAAGPGRGLAVLKHHNSQRQGLDRAGNVPGPTLQAGVILMDHLLPLMDIQGQAEVGPCPRVPPSRSPRG